MTKTENFLSELKSEHPDAAEILPESLLEGPIQQNTSIDNFLSLFS